MSYFVESKDSYKSDSIKLATMAVGLASIISYTAREEPAIDYSFFSNGARVLSTTLASEPLGFTDAFLHEYQSTSQTVYVKENYKIEKSKYVLFGVRELVNDFGLSKSLISDIVGVSRPAVYSWLENPSIMNNENQKKIEKISKVLSVMECSHRSLLGKMLKFHALGRIGVTLGDALEESVEKDSNVFEETYLAMRDKFELHLANSLPRKKYDQEVLLNQVGSLA